MHTANNNSDILQRILEHKRQEIISHQAITPLELLQNAIATTPPLLRGFAASLAARINAGQAGVIAEIKRASPSKGLLRTELNPADLARSYEHGGATCISVLTDQHFFQGSNADLIAARQACSLPILRKDFIIDAYQIYQAHAIGADAILLIAAGLNDVELSNLATLAKSLGLDVLLEVHNSVELQRALQIKPDIIGINNRNLHTFEVKLHTTIELLSQVPPGVLLVTESGIRNRADVKLMLSHGVQGFLVGESLVSAQDPGSQLIELFGQ